MGVVGVWPHGLLLTDRHLHRKSRRRKKKGGKISRSRWCTPDISLRLSEDIKQLLSRDDCIIPTMPGGFENSSMKSSFSLSSLQPSSRTLESPEHATLHDRPYSSLRKKPRKDPEIDSWRRSWGRETNKDEFWAALENNYQYLMDNNLIDSCQEARRDLLCGASPTREWSFEQFTTQFSELDSWLNSIENAMYNKSESVIDRKLRLSQMEELQRNTYKRKFFNNQGGRLVARSPDLKDEVAFKMRYLNSKWERLEHYATPRKRTYPDLPNVCPDVEHELRCLQKWLRATEERLPPLNFQQSLTSQEIEDRLKEYEVIARDVWTHGRIVRSVVRRCERLSAAEEENDQSSSPSTPEDGSTDTPVSSRHHRQPSKAAQFAKRLEKRWGLLYISCVERQVHLDGQKNSSERTQDSPQSVASVESDEEPVIKHRKLSDSPSQLEQDDVDGCLMEVVEEGGEQMEFESPQELHQDIVVDGDPFLTPIKYITERHETSKFTNSSRMGKNCATVYFRHKDTDTEGPEEKSGEESSEEEWTFKRTQEEPEEKVTTHPAQQVVQVATQVEEYHQEPSVQTERPGHEIIQRLVEKAEQIVSSPVRVRSSFKCPRVEEWLHHQYPGKAVGDSCDASGEYTTEDDEIEARIEEVTDSIQDLDATLVNDSRLDSSPFSPEQQPRVILRMRKREGGGQRPWSVSGSTGVNEHSPDLLSHSISESAIHQLEGAPTHHTGKMESSMHTGSTLSSSTVEDTTQTQEGSGGGYSSNSLRRRKIKLRKRTMGRKSESGSEGLLVQSDTTTVISSAKGSPTKTGQRRLSYDKAADCTHRRAVQPVESPTSSSSPSEEESDGSVKMKQKLLQMPAFRIGPSHTLSSYASDRKERVVVSNDSSFSEQAWDNYQEKYMSEAYSEELVDSETAKRLLEFGDDYRNFLDSQSDCASSLGRVPLSRRPRAKVHHGMESDSNLDDVWHLVQKSTKHLHFSEQIFNNLSKSSPHLVLASDFAELIANCRENVRCLTVLLEKIEEDAALLSEQDCKEIRGLIERWDGLAKSADDLQTNRSLRREIHSRKEEIIEINDRAARLDTKLTDWDQLELRIQEIRRETSRLKEVKSKVHSVNVAVHRFITDSGHQDQALKEEVAQLYGLWEDTCHRLVSEEERLEETRVRWSEFDSNLAVLEGALRSDSETLRLLDAALASDGALSPSLANSARDLAKLLNEHHPLPTEPQTTDEMTGGSLSDSGISDSGSEQDLSERERRLAALRRLARHLEAVLAPGSAAILSMAKRIEATEHELRGLQQTCRELIVRTAVCAEAKCPLPPLSRQRPPNTRCPEEGEKRNGDGWLWRVIRTAFPFQLALMALFCFACLLEPHCCDSMNTLTISIPPQLRYLRGPPPV